MTPEQKLIRKHRSEFARWYELGVEPPLHPDYCGPCRDCRTALADYERRGVKRNIRLKSRKELLAKGERA